MLPAAHRLRQSGEIQRVRQQGRARRHPLLVFIALPGAQPESRFAFIASRRVGKAVARNRAKRLLREAVHFYLPQIESGWDCVIIARQQSVDATFADVKTAVAQLLLRAGLLPEIEP